MFADGGEAISDLAVLRDQPALFGPVASDPTVAAAVAVGGNAASAVARGPCHGAISPALSAPSPARQSADGEGGPDRTCQA